MFPTPSSRLPSRLEIKSFKGEESLAQGLSDILGNEHSRSFERSSEFPDGLLHFWYVVVRGCAEVALEMRLSTKVHHKHTLYKIVAGIDLASL